ncbi:MAG: fibrobacter succinogenes major paralogous domain-containing protein [Methylococcaceae bacterium]|nr:fibrobacter succinogenes major paralogous domain-containing protein [Prolixibacteraceae bacterium]
MKHGKLIYYLVAIICFLAITNSCHEDDNEQSSPELITLEVKNITNISALSNAEIVNKGKYEIIRQGICWSTKPNPTIADFHIRTESEADTFSITITDLLPNTTYYLRAYATNYISTGYGNEIVFTTTGEKPVLSTDVVNIKTYNSVECFGTISSNGGDIIVATGFCWSEQPEPSIADNKNIMHQGGGQFSSIIPNLKSNTKYYIRAYATNNVGTTYGDIKDFTLWLNVQDDPIKDVDGNRYHTIKIGNQIWMQENLKVTKFQNGARLKQLNNLSSYNDMNSPGYYTNVDNSLFGFIYNGYSITDMNKISPEGWHVPTQSDWDILLNYLGGYSVAGGKMKETSDSYWITPNVGADNSSGFSALPNGYVGFDGSPHDKLEEACFMADTLDSKGNPAFVGIEYNHTSAFISGTSSKVTGASIRCVKN